MQLFDRLENRENEQMLTSPIIVFYIALRVIIDFIRV